MSSGRAGATRGPWMSSHDTFFEDLMIGGEPSTGGGGGGISSLDSMDEEVEDSGDCFGIVEEGVFPVFGRAQVKEAGIFFLGLPFPSLHGC